MTRAARIRAAGVLLAAAVLALAGCSSSAPPPVTSSGSGGTQAAPSRVRVDTPALRAQKRAAGIEPCRPGTGTTGATPAPPDVTLPCLGGGPAVNLATLRGPMVVNLFAQWCGPCRNEMPYYQQLHEKGRGVVQVLGVDYVDTQPGLALQLAKQTGVTYPLLADPDGSLQKDLRIFGVPGMVFIDKDGRMVGVQFREVRSYAELRGLVQDKLGVRLPA